VSERWLEFDVKKDNELIAAGTHFWCHACQIAKPNSQLSDDTRYCQGCYDFLLKEGELEGKRAGSWKPVNGSDVSSPTDGLQASKKRVLSQVMRDNLRSDGDKTTGNGIKHAGGRPRKTAGYSKRTGYRREKEKRGVMAI